MFHISNKKYLVQLNIVYVFENYSISKYNFRNNIIIMNIFTDILFLFIFLCTLLFLRLPDVINHNYIYHELCLFIAVFVYFYTVELIKTIKNKCKIKPYNMLKDTLTMSLYTIIGYVIYVQLMYMDWSKDYFSDVVNVCNTSKRFISISLIMVMFITLIKLSGMLFKNNNSDSVDCIN
jgi:hypothetical protein